MGGPSRRWLCLTHVLVAALAVSARSSNAAVINVAAGSNLFQTEPGTTFLGVGVQGVPLGSFDFGGSIGTKGVGNADTIVARATAAIAPGIPGTASPVNVTLQAFQLRSVTQTDLGLGTDFYFITLQSARGGPASTGTTTITFTSSSAGTFDSSINIAIDLRKGALNGPIAQSVSGTFTESATLWQRTPPNAFDILIDGVNHNLDGGGTATDFWPSAFTTYSSTSPQATLQLDSATPEPASLGVAAGGLAMIVLRRRRGAK